MRSLGKVSSSPNVIGSMKKYFPNFCFYNVCKYTYYYYLHNSTASIAILAIRIQKDQILSDTSTFFNENVRFLKIDF